MSCPSNLKPDPVFILSTAKISDKHLHRLQQTVPGARVFYSPMDKAGDLLGQAHVLVTFGVDLTPEHIEKCTNLKWLHIFSAGLDDLPAEELLAKDILVTNSRGIHAIPMAEYTMSAVLNLCRRSLELFRNQQKKQWDHTVRMKEAYGQTIGIIGVGAIGSCIAQRAKAFGMTTLGMNTTGREVPYVDRMYAPEGLHHMLAECDFVVMVLPLTDETRNSFGSSEFKAMKSTAFFINISRGPVVNENALINALREKQIAGAVLDVFEREPLPEDSPLWTMENVIITPHLSGWSTKYMTRAMDIFIHNLKVFTAGTGQFLNVVDLSKGY